ncbi:MAG: NAD-dependent epimerase/dehydratase family protein, partial [Planctomycetota bacterium]
MLRLPQSNRSIAEFQTAALLSDSHRYTVPTSLVTGASGFIGPRLVARLQKAGSEVVCLVRGSSNTDRLAPLGVRLVTGDVTDPASLIWALDGIDEVYHLAGKLHASRLEDYLAVNEQGAKNLAQACAQRETSPVLINVSSLAAAGPSSAGKPHTEADPSRPISMYGKSKLASEQALRPFANDVPITTVRPPVVFGPGDRDGFLMFQGIRRTRLHPVPNRSGLPLSLIHADDLCEALFLAGDRGERMAPNQSAGDSTGLYYAADPTPSTWADAGRMAADGMGVGVWVIKLRKWPFIIPALVGDLMGRLSGKPSIFGMDKLREASATGWVCSVEKAASELGFAP